ncbi:MAG: cysteine desulfurase [Deltaproteobacteria bacterium]|nr:cysteine desulfurase [Deltaproteobacteria bacterium]
MEPDPIYLDYNATTPVDPEVVEAMRPYLERHFGNPSSGHRYGIRAREAVEKARAQVADFLGCAPGEIIFTSGGTESNNLAIRGIMEARGTAQTHIITSAIEHPAVTEVCRYLENRGVSITYLPVDEQGLLQLETLEISVTSDTSFITIMHANNEVGTIQPIEEICTFARWAGIPVHTDAAQSVGKIPVTVDGLGVDLLSLAGHKLYGPKGVGALYIREGIELKKQMHGAGHERDLRPGTENVPEIVGLGEACKIALRRLEDDMAHLTLLRDRLREQLTAHITGIRVNGHPEKCLPNTLNVSIPGIDYFDIASLMTDVALSMGSACHADSMTVSPVLTAMGVPPEYARGTIRISTGRFTTEDEVNRAGALIIQHMKKA